MKQFLSLKRRPRSTMPFLRTATSKYFSTALRNRLKKFQSLLHEKTKPIHHTLGPLALTRQTFLSLWIFLQPWRHRHAHAREMLRGLLEQEHGMRCSFFSSGREALFAILKSLHLRPGEEVLLQAYTCGVLPNAIHAAGGAPIYVDTAPRSLNMDPKRVEEAMSPRVRAVICQHTFGVAADIPSLRGICDRHSCALIEDCAHCIPSKSKPEPEPQPGTVGDFILMSFGRDKVISGITGGAVLTPHAFSHRELINLEETASELPLYTIERLLLYPLIMAIARPLYGLHLGQAFLAVLRKIRILLPVITEAEKRGQLNPQLHRLPNACAALVLQQFHLLPELQQHRRAVTKMYQIAFPSETHSRPIIPHNHPPLIRFPLLLQPDNLRSQPSLFQPSQKVAHRSLGEGGSIQASFEDLPLRSASPSGPDGLREELKKLNIHLSDGWHGATVLPPSFDQERTGYRAGSCPNAEFLARSVLNLPTHPMMRRTQVQRLIAALKMRLPPPMVGEVEPQGDEARPPLQRSNLSARRPAEVRPRHPRAKRVIRRELCT